MSKQLNLFFVIPSYCKNELDTSPDMQEAFEAYRQNHLGPEWIREAEILTVDLSKNEIVCFDKFEGAVFEELSNRKCLRVVGPRCLSVCLMNNIQVPSNGRPVFNVAMMNMKISITNLPVEKKLDLQKKIEYMGGVFCQQITSYCTHLISSGTRSKKYCVAVLNQLPIMLDTWVDAVWKDNLKIYRPASDQEYLKYKCPTFHELIISSTGFVENERNEFKKLIEENGGTFSPRMNVNQTSILLCKSNSVNSEKFLSATKRNIACVGKEWLYDSVKAGVTLPTESYVIKVSSSTPTKHSRPPDFDMSTMSVICGPNAVHIGDKTTLDCSNFSMYKNSSGSVSKTQRSDVNSPKKVMEKKVLNFDLKEIKGQNYFLDGCSVYLIGFSSNVREKLNKILKLTGATRYDDMSDRVTQVVVGDENCHELKLLSKKGCSAPLVSVEWLMESIKMKQPDWEQKYLVSVKGSPATNDPPASPSVNRGLVLLKANTSTKENTATRWLDFGNEANAADPKGDDVMQHYLPKARTDEDDSLARLLANEQVNTKVDLGMDTVKIGKNEPTLASNIETHIEDMDTTNDQIFRGKTFILLGFNEEAYNDFNTIIKNRGGIVKNQKFAGIPDYAVAPTFISDLNISASEIVNQFYIHDCDNNNQIVPKLYYHEPIVTDGTSKPLKGLIITSSNYITTERLFLKELIEYLGATCEKVLAKNVTTHLICKTAVGKKYKGAKSWGIICISHKWLFACLDTDQRVNEELYPVPTNEENDTMQNVINKRMESLPKYLPTPPKHSMSKLDISVTSARNEETPKSKGVESTLLGCEKPSIEISARMFEDMTMGKDKSITNIENIDLNSPSVRKRFADQDKSEDDPKKKITNFGTPSIIHGDEKIKENCDEDGLLQLDGEKVSLAKFMDNLRREGLFERGSPAGGYNVSPYVVPKNTNIKVSTPRLQETIVEHASQDTPVGKYIKGLQQKNILPGTSGAKGETPDSPIPKMNDVKTPNTPLGAFLCEGNAEPSPNTRKYWQRRIDRLPGSSQAEVNKKLENRRLSTPLSALKNQAWAWLLRSDKDQSFGTFKKRRKMSETQFKNVEMDEPACESEAEPVTSIQLEKPPENIEVTNNLKKLKEMLSSNETGKSSTSRRSSLYKADNSTPSRFKPLQCNLFADKDSQQDNVGWADPVESEDLLANKKPPEVEKIYRKFMLSGISLEEKTKCERIISSLGGEMSNISSFDPTATHLVCQSANRNEKILASIASGKHIIHFQYVYDSEKNGEFLTEQPYEFGNPSFNSEIKFSHRPGANIESYYWWRKHIAETGKKAFNGMRIILFANNKEALTRLVEAGDGVIVNLKPPFNHNVDATHCLIDFKGEHNLSDFVPVAKQGIPCLNVVFLSHYLHSMGHVDLMHHIPAELKQYYQ